MGAILALSAGLAACSTTKKDTADYAYSGTGERAPAGTTPALVMFVESLAKSSTYGREAAEQKILALISANAEKWGIPAAKNLNTVTLRNADKNPLTAQQEETIMKNLKNSTTFSKTVGVKQTDVITAYNTSSKSAEVMGSSTVGKGKMSLAPGVKVETGLGADVDAVVNNAKGDVQETLITSSKQLHEIATSHPEFKNVASSIARENAAIVEKTGETVLGKTGCSKIVDEEALTNLNQTLKLTKHDVVAGENLDKSFQRNLAKVTDEEITTVCANRIVPLGEQCDVVHPKRVAACK